MKEEKTISTHVSGDARARRHNKRDREVTDNEPHIDPNGYHETLVDESTVHAYHRLFDPAVEEYNARQTRADRKIKNYHAKVEADPRKHTCYEMTICVGSKDNPVDRDLGYTIMREYVDGWQDRNPNLELIGAYYHADEEGVPGWHLDFIPVAYGFKNGPSVQTALSRALVEQGFGYVKGRNEDGLRQTPQIQWERSENDTLEAICNKYGVKVEHPERGKDAKHLATSVYKELQDEVRKLKSQVKQLSGDLEDAKSEKQKMDDSIEAVVKDVDFVLQVNELSPDDRKAYNGLSPAGKAELLRSVISYDASILEQPISELKSQKKTLEDDIRGLEQQKKDKQGELSKIESEASERLEKANKQKEQADNIVSQIPKGLDEISTAVEVFSKAVIDTSGSLKKERKRSDNIKILSTLDEKRGLNGRIKQYASVVIKNTDYAYLKTMAEKVESLKDVPDSMKEISDKQDQLEASVTRYLTPIDDLVEEKAEKKEKELQDKLDDTQKKLSLSNDQNTLLSNDNQRLIQENNNLETQLSDYNSIKQAFPDQVQAMKNSLNQRSLNYDEPSGHGAR